MKIKIEVSLSPKQLEALKKFKTIGYYGGYELIYKVKEGFNFEPEVEKAIISALEQCAKGARRKRK